MKIFPENCWYWSSDPRLQSWDCGRDWSWYRSGRDTSGYHRIWVSHYRPISLSLAETRAWGLSRLSPVLGILTPISQSSRPLSHHRTGIPSSDQRHVRLMTHWQSNAPNDIIIQCTFIETKCDWIKDYFNLISEPDTDLQWSCTCSFCKLCLDKSSKRREGNNLNFIIHDPEIFVSKICWPARLRCEIERCRR